MKNLTNLKIDLEQRKEKFNAYRISNGKISKLETLVEEKASFDKNLESLIAKQSIKNTVNQFFATMASDSMTNGEDNVKAVKSYSEKIKGGYFGKRRSRF